MKNRIPLLTLLAVCLMLVACDTKTNNVDSCGNGFVDPGEECDGNELSVSTCQDLGFYEQVSPLSCREDCSFNLTSCNGRCGDRVIQLLFGEACDGNDLDGQTCESLSFESGTLACSSGCQELDTSGCTMDYESPNIGTLIYVPAGTFQRDATATNLSTVSAFHMSKYEITRSQWVVVTGWTDPSNVTISSGTNDPVWSVSWYDAIAFCNKLSLLEGLTPVYTVSGVNFSTLTYEQIPTAYDAAWFAATANWSADGYRLPTEMEWMWAAMGADSANPGGTNARGYLKEFAGSTQTNAIGDYAWYVNNSGNKTHPAGSKLPNELGLYDLSGNVFEWTWDWYGAYPAGTLTDYRGAADNIHRVMRGGDWSFSSSYCAVADRCVAGPDNRSCGFRVVRN